MKTSDIPFLQGDNMPDTAKPDQKTEPKADTKPAARPEPTSSGGLAPAGEASDPRVHQLLAELEAAKLNENDDARRDIRDALRELGYSAE